MKKATKIIIALATIIPFISFAPEQSWVNKGLIKPKIEQKSVEELNISNVHAQIIELEFKEPEMVLKQVLLESGMLKSWLAKHNNNLMGMKYPRVRETTAVLQQKGYACYENWVECLKDLKIYQDLYMKEDESYVEFLVRVGYAEDKHYVNKLNSIKVNITNTCSNE